MWFKNARPNRGRHVPAMPDESRTWQRAGKSSLGTNNAIIRAVCSSHIRIFINAFPHVEILETLGHGGMGAVYKARQNKLDRVVALKIVRPDNTDDPTFTVRFNREARTLARLNHPSIVGFYDFVDEHGKSSKL
jgi:serine/threonine protein kinase